MNSLTDSEYITTRPEDFVTSGILRQVISRLIVSDECWDWSGAKSRGYGLVYLSKGEAGRRTTRNAHVVVYEMLRGAVPSGLVLDHLCRNPSCSNPDHLEPVTMKENVLRGVGPTAINSRKTHCSNGHAYSDENTYTIKRPNGALVRDCVTCRKATKLRYLLRKNPFRRARS